MSNIHALSHVTRRLPSFTLIELLVVISIIGILAALLLANFASARDRAEDAKTKSNLKQLQTALRLRYNDVGSYPTATPLPDLTAYMSTEDIPTLQSYTGTSDTFVACATLLNTADTEAGESTIRCGVSVSPGKYCVCSL